MNNTTKKTQIIALMTTMLIALSLPMFATTVSADVLPDWDVTGEWVIQTTFGSKTYDHDFTLTMSSNGEFTGTGGYPAGGPYTITETVTGTVAGDSITWQSVYNTGYSWDFVGTIASNGIISGTWGNDGQGYGHDCCSISGIAQPAILTLTFPPGSSAEAFIKIIPDKELPDCAPEIPGLAATPYINVEISGEFEGIVKVCIRYDETGMTLAQEKKLRLYRLDCVDVDFNDDDTINGMDLSIIKKHIKAYEPEDRFLEVYDVNNDDAVDDADVDIVKEYMANGLVVNQGHGAESQMRLPWLDITLSVDTDLNIICGETDHFSIFRGR